MNRTQLRSYDNAWYKPGNRLKILGWYVISRLFIDTSIPFPYFLKRGILNLFGAKIAAGVVIKQRVLIKYPWFLTIGTDAWIGENVWIDNLTQVTIGCDCCLSQGAMLLTGNHNYKKSTFDLITKPITIENGAWIGAKATVCPGVIVGEHAVLSVGSVATTNLNAFGIYQGNPASYKAQREII